MTLKTLSVRQMTCGRIPHVCALGVLLALLTSSPHAAGSDKSRETFITRGEPGGLLVETTEYLATVTALDAASQRITLVDAQGQRRTYQTGPMTGAMRSMKRGDHVRVTVTAQYLSFVHKPGSDTDHGDTRATRIVHPQGAQPGMLWSSTTEWSGRIASVDLKKRMATVVFPDGRRQTCQVRPDVDMTRHKAGEEVVFRMTESVAVRPLK